MLISFLICLLFGNINPNVLVIGDSITAWENNYVDILKEKTTYTYKKVGYPGIASGGLLEKFKKMNLKKYQMVIIEVGLNNLNDRNDCSNVVIKDIWEMIKIAKNHNLTVVVLTIPPYKGYQTWSTMRQSNLELINKWILAFNNDIIIPVDIYTPLSDNDTQKYTVDKLHPNRKGHEIIADEIIKKI